MTFKHCFAMSKLGLVGQLSVYDDSNEEFSLYIERLEQYFLANDVEEAKRVPVLISVLGPKTYKLLRNLLTPQLPKDCAYIELIQKLQDHFRATPITIAERFNFHRRNQGERENIAEYLVELKRLASTCEFGHFLEEALRDRFVCGIRCEATQKRLLAKKNLKLDEASEIALAIELAEQGSTNIKVSSSANVYKVSKSAEAQRKWNKSSQMYKNACQKCHHCGALHSADKRKYKTAKCYACHKIGHIAPVCKSNKQNFSAKKVSADSEPSDAESTHSKELFNVLVHDRENSLLSRDFVLNPDIKEIDFTDPSFSSCDFKSITERHSIIQQLKSRGETITLLRIEGYAWPEEDLVDLTSSLPNVESLILRNTHTSEKVLGNIQNYCRRLVKLDVTDCNIDDIALKALYTKGRNIGMNSSLLSLSVDDTLVTTDGVAFILKSFSNLRILEHSDVCQTIHDIHLSDFINNSLSVIKYSLTLLNVERPKSEHDLGESFFPLRRSPADLHGPNFLLNTLKICSVVCPYLLTLCVKDINSQTEIEACSGFHKLEVVQFSSSKSKILADIMIDHPPMLTVTPFLESNGKNLTSLHVSDLNISGESVVKCCPKLQSLFLSNTMFERLRVRKTGSPAYLLTDLKELHVEKMDFCNEILAESIDLILSSAPNLEMIHFNYVENLTPDFVKSIENHNCMSTVLKFDVSHTEIPFLSARKMLFAAPNLKNFKIWECGITYSEYKILKSLRKDVKIVWYSISQDHSTVH